MVGASVGDRVWLDVNQDGFQDVTGEEGVPGLMLNLLDEMNNVIATTVTMDKGQYLFQGLAPGTYTVQLVDTPVNTFQTFELDSSLDRSVTVTLASGEAKLDVDFGFSGEYLTVCSKIAADTMISSPQPRGLHMERSQRRRKRDDWRTVSAQCAY